MMNMQNMMRQAQKLQKQMEQSQAELEAIIVDKDNHCFQTGGIYKMRIS